MNPILTPDSNTQFIQDYQVSCASLSNNSLTYPQEDAVLNENNENVFIYKPPNDLQIYGISCKEIPVSFDLVSQLMSNINNNYPNNLHEFHFLKYDEKKCYKVICELIPHSSIVQYLNKNIHGILTEQVEQQEYVEFSRELKENLEYYLTQFLTSR